jgi:hypothetical protein
LSPTNIKINYQSHCINEKLYKCYSSFKGFLSAKNIEGVFYLQSVNNKEFLYNEKLKVIIKIYEYLNLSLFKFSKAGMVIEIFGKVIETIFIDDAFLQSPDLENTHSLFSLI